MADIFELKGLDAELKIGSATYKFADPNFLKKNLLQKKFSELESERMSIDRSDYTRRSYELNRELVKLYLPDLGDDVLDQIGEHAFLALLDKLLTLTSTTFGAVVEKIEKKL